MDYDINKKVEDKYESTLYNQEEIKTMLLGYDVLPPEMYELLKPGNHIRYKTKDGKFRRGGYVHNVKVNGDKVIFLETSKNSKDSNYKKWPVYFANLDTVWKKRTIEDAMINTVKVNNNENDERILDLEARVQLLETNLEKLKQTCFLLVNKIKKTNKPS